jgi:hypothetical protein
MDEDLIEPRLGRIRARFEARQPARAMRPGGSPNDAH